MRLPTPLEAWLESEFPRPMEIQEKGIPVALLGKNLVGVAKTGSGKTFAYLIPAVLHIGIHHQGRERKSWEGPRVWVLAPTRELVNQIREQADVLLENLQTPGVRAVSIFGSTKYLQLKHQVN